MYRYRIVCSGMYIVHLIENNDMFMYHYTIIFYNVDKIIKNMIMKIYNNHIAQR